MPVDPKGWKDEWDVDDEEGSTLWHFELEARPAQPDQGEPDHAFIGTLTVSDYADEDGDNHTNPRVVFRCERGSLNGAVIATKEAAKRADLLRVGPRH